MGDIVRARISELLPFYLNGTLDDAARGEVERALSDDAALRAELEVLAALRRAVREEDPVRSPGELGLGRLRREIAPKRTWLRSAAALAAAFALGVVLTALATGYGPSSREPAYEQAGAPALENTLLVAFRDEATASQIAELLLTQEATIIDGPSAIGLYRVALPAGADAVAALRGLRAAVAVVESAEIAE